MVQQMITLFDSVLETVPNVGNDEQLRSLLGQIENNRNEPSNNNTNDGCWRSSKKYKDIDWLIKEITSTVSNAIKYYSNKDQVFAEAVKNLNIKDLKIFYWTNVNQPLSRNVIHSHKSAIFSGVYYLQGTDTGNLRFINPANILGECNNWSPFTRDFFYTPSDRDLTMWPSWLPHEVETNLSNRERINIAYDIII